MPCSESLTVEEMVEIDVEKTLNFICNIFEIGDRTINLKNSKEHFFKHSKKMYNKGHKIFSTRFYTLDFEKSVRDEEGNHLVNFFKDKIYKKEKAGVATYQHCHDNEYNNYFVLELSMKNTNEHSPSKFVIMHPFSSGEIEEAFVADKNYVISPLYTELLRTVLKDKTL